jgi:nucleotide-binding universal stress UspA family protein
MSGSEISHLHRRSGAEAAAGLIAVAVDGDPESRDAAVLAASVADVTKADVMLVAVHPGAPVVLPAEMGWAAVHERAADMVHELRDSVLPDAGILIETDQSVGRAVERVATLGQRDLLVLGSSCEATLGHVRVDNRTRHLLEQAQCAVAIAPKGQAARPPQKFQLIGVGYDGKPEAREAVRQARAFASVFGAKLRVEAVLDDRLPGDRHPPVDGLRQEVWDCLREPEVESLPEDAESAAVAPRVDAEVTATRGSPADLLLAQSEAVDLLVIGSPGSGPVGSTVQRLLHDARCPVVVVTGSTQSASAKTEPPASPDSRLRAGHGDRHKGH